MHGAVFVAELQIMFFTFYLFLLLVSSKASALKIFQTLLNWFLLTQPLVTYSYIFLGIVYEDNEMAGTLKKSKHFLWSRLLHKNSRLFSLRHYIIYPFIFLALSYGIPISDSFISSIRGVFILLFCYVIVMVLLLSVIKKYPYL